MDFKFFKKTADFLFPEHRSALNKNEYNLLMGQKFNMDKETSSALLGDLTRAKIVQIRNKMLIERVKK